MKKLCLLLLGLVLLLPAFSQSEKGYVYLKNGTIIKGRYAYTGDQQKIKIQSAGNLWIFDAAEVDSITSRRNRSREDVAAQISDRKFFYRAELGVLVGNSDNSQNAPFSLSGSVNYVLNPRFSLGAGLGVEFFKETYMPLFANLEYKLRGEPSSPYVFLKAGYEVPLEQSNAVYYDVVPMWYDYWPYPDVAQEGFDCKGGFLINPGVGYQQMFSPGFGMNFAVGYQFHRLNYSGENDYELDIDYNRLTIKLGIIFN